ncbi:MAG: ATP-binding protein, partial [Planctomycetota bacterium]
VFQNRHLEGFKEFQITGQGPVIGKTVELTALRRNGEEFPIELSLSGVQIKGKWNAIGIIRDITERKILNARLLAEIEGRKKVQERLKHLIKELERSNAELQQFAYVASHDLQEPLRMVSSYTQLLRRRYKGKLDADADEFIAFAVDGAARMQMLINDLLEYSRVSTKGKEFEKVNCLNIFDHAISNLRIAIEECGAVITHDEFPTVMADTLQFTQLFQNLLGNAIKFRGKEPPRIHISVAQKEGEWLFSIRDNGIGIDPQYVDRIFVIFQRLHSKEEYPGSGIGLAICKKIVERHGGLIWVESEPGKGATFHFTIPMVNAV